MAVLFIGVILAPRDLPYTEKGKEIVPIRHFRKNHNNLFVHLKILHNHCFQFFLRLRIVPRETENNGYAKCFWGDKKIIMVFSEVANRVSKFRKNTYMGG